LLLAKFSFSKISEVPFTIIHLKRLPLKFYVYSGFIVPQRERERERERERINSGEEKQEKILNEKFQTQISFLN
jgi:hypothetical protein